MKRAELLVLLFFPLFIFSQELSKKDDSKIINKYLSLVKTEKGYIFTDNKGKQSQEYTYVYLKENGFIETIVVLPHNPDIIIETDNRCYTYDNSNRRDYHVLELMKELKIIDDYLFIPFDELTWANVRDGKISDFGSVSKDNKLAMVTNKGEFLTDFKYNNIIEDNNKPIFNNYTEKGKLVSVVLDKFTGKELFVTKDSIAIYWNTENYVLKNKSDKYSLTYQSKKYNVPKEFSYLKGLPFESHIFTYSRNSPKFESGFMDIKGKKIETPVELIPQTNFYKGHCIVWEIKREERKYNFYGEALPQKETKTVKIVNEKFETVKILPEVKYTRSTFNKYGQTIVYDENDNSFVIDYNGNYIIPPSKFKNRIYQVYEGLYEVVDKTNPRTRESQEQGNFYNQKGEKLLNQETLRIARNMEFKEGIEENYLVSYSHKLITLDKENNVVKSYY